MNVLEIEKRLYYTIKKSLDSGLEKKDYYYWRDMLSMLYGKDYMYNSPNYIIINAIEELLKLINDSGILFKISKENVNYVVENSILLPLVLTNNNGKNVKLSFKNSYMFNCPFHDDTNPSFSVTDIKNLGHCFGCDKTVNVVSYLKSVENLSYTEAIELLSYIYLIDLRTHNKKLEDLSHKYQDTIKGYEYLELLKQGYDRLKRKNLLNDDIDEMFQKRFSIIDRIKNGIYDQNFVYKENPKRVKLTLEQIK